MLKEPTPEYCRELLQYIPQRPDYEMWMRIIAAVTHTFPESVALSLLLERFTDEQPDEHKKTIALLLGRFTFIDTADAKRIEYVRKLQLKHKDEDFRALHYYANVYRFMANSGVKS